MKSQRILHVLAMMACATLLLILTTSAFADSSYNEDVDGDLSNDRTAPTQVELRLGRNQLSATSVKGDREYVAIHLAEGQQLEHIIVASYVSSDAVAFIGMQQGITFTELPTNTNQANLLGWAHFGLDSVGTDILDDMAALTTTIGFTPPLASGDYVLWLQQASVTTTTYTLDLLVAPLINSQLHDETVNGDLSGDRAQPTAHMLGNGGNLVSGTFVRGDRDYLKLNVPLGHEVQAVLLADYASEDGTSFMAVQTGVEFSEPFSGTTVANLLGYAHFGPDVEPLGSDILDNMGKGDGALGFTGTLSAGDYTFWLQQTGLTTTTYTVNFVLAPVATQMAYDESLAGDLSNDRSLPTTVTVGSGGNIISATSQQGDREYYTLAVPEGHQLEAIFLKSYSSSDETAFIGVQQGSTFSEPPTNTNVANLLGWTHFGPSVEAVGSNILDNMGVGGGAIGFSGALPSGDYTFWSQQAGSSPTEYELNFVIAKVMATPPVLQVFLPVVTR